MSMRKFFTICFAIWSCISIAQVKSNYLYSTSMPYGTLDIRTTITSTNYYYLLEGKTFGFRESSPGIKTNSFLDMTSTWDSSPYKQGNLRHKADAKDLFVMNYRLLPPLNYNSSFAQGYPLIVIVHGAVERGNCYYNNCYHSNWDYDPNVNAPAAPTSSTHKLLNNDNHLNIGGKTHLDSRNLAAGKLPDDPTLSSRAFPGFVLMAQMFNEWNANNIQDLIRLVQLHCKKYKIDQNRIYIHGLSIGGYGVYEAIKRAPWLFAAALPMSAVNDAQIFTQNMQSKVIHMPLWIFQGGQDTAPSPSYTNGLVNKFKSAGAVVRYTVFSDLGHNVWNRAYGQSDFFTWMLSKNKANIHAYAGNTTIVRSQSKYPKLILAEGFLAYQWEKDGVIISAAKSNTYTATAPGKYRARFSRLSTAPTSTQWNKWSVTVTVTESTTTTAAALSNEEIIESKNEFDFEVFPNPVTNQKVSIQLTVEGQGDVNIKLINSFGSTMFDAKYEVLPGTDVFEIPLPAGMTRGLYFIVLQRGQTQLRKKLMVAQN